ncbi:hypothetical protein QF017_000781 [Pseudomonas laurylsulfatiphila]
MRMSELAEVVHVAYVLGKPKDKAGFFAVG